MKGREDIESYLVKMGAPYEQLRPDLWSLKGDGYENLLVSLAGPVVAFRLKLMELPSKSREALFHSLLTLNTTDMVHGAFGLEGAAIVIVAALELENLDLNEFQAVIDDFGLAVSKHHGALSKFRA